MISPQNGVIILATEGPPKTFDAYYYAHGCGELPYQRDPIWLDMFDQIAKRIIQDIQPRAVLDAGCAMGFLVEGLRKFDVEAFGVDISDYAIQNVHENIKPYCWQGSITDSFPQKYDLIVTIEVLEHMSKEQSEAAVANLCAHSDDILFSSSPFDYKEPTHFNVQPPEYWVNIFSRHSFYRDVDFDASFITPWTVRFRKLNDPIQRVIGSYERKLWILLQDSQGQRDLNQEQRAQLASLQMELDEQKIRIQELEMELTKFIQKTPWYKKFLHGKK
jgi:hypothetical protein